MKHLLALMATALLWASPLHAHNYYYYIDVTSQLEMNEQQQLAQVNFTWDYGNEVSKLMLDGLDQNSPEDMKAFGNRLFEDLSELGFFTQLTLNQKTINLLQPTSYVLNVVNDKRVQLKLDFQLQQPVVLKGKTLAMELIDLDGTALLQHKAIHAPSGCKTSIKQNQAVPPKRDFKHEEPVQRAAVKCAATL